MKRWLSISLGLAILTSLAAVFDPRATEAENPISPAETKALTDAFPDVALLRPIAKDLVAREVAAGRRSLPDAAALYHSLDRLPPVQDESTPSTAADPAPATPDRTDEERLYRQVIAHVRVALRDEPPSVAEEVVTRLEVEFWEERRQRGAVRRANPSELPPVQELLDRARTVVTDGERQRRSRLAQRVGGAK